MIHKILFSLFVSFWILGIGQGYVLQGQETTMVEIKAEFTIRNRLDIPAMMEKAGYKNIDIACITNPHLNPSLFYRRRLRRDESGNFYTETIAAN